MQLRIWRVHQPLGAILFQGSTGQCRTHLGHLSGLVKGWSIESIAWCVRCGSCALLQFLNCLTGNLNKSMTPAKIEQANSPASLTDCKPWPEHTDATGSTITVDCWPQQTNIYKYDFTFLVTSCTRPSKTWIHTQDREREFNVFLQAFTTIGKWLKSRMSIPNEVVITFNSKPEAFAGRRSRSSALPKW